MVKGEKKMSLVVDLKKEVLEDLYSLPPDYIRKILSNYDREFPRLIMRIAPNDFIEQVKLMELKPLIKEILKQIEDKIYQEENFYTKTL